MAAKLWNLFWRSLAVFIFVCQGVSSLKIIELQVPAAVLRGEPITLNCTFDLEGDDLYAIQWYKDHIEFFRYAPTDNPPGQQFAARGIYLDPHFQHGSSLRMDKTDLLSEGTYKCEVSADAPSFQTVAAEKELRVYSNADESLEYDDDHVPVGILDYLEEYFTDRAGNLSTSPYPEILDVASSEKSYPESLGIPRCANKSPSWMDLGGDFCYIIEKEDEVSWTDAVYRCSREGGYLASFHSSEEIERIVNYAKKEYGRLYMGLWKHSDGSFEWVDKSSFDFRNWDHREPTYREEQCVEIYTETGKWNDIRCDRSLGYVCSARKDQPSRESTKVCPDTSTKWSDFGGEACYIIEADNDVTWDEALRLCSEEGGSLASFHSIEEVSVLLQHTKSYYERMHIGLQQREDGKFYWSDKSPFDLEYWDFGEPNDETSELCGEMYPHSGQWNDIPCDKTVGYICSTPKVEPGTSRPAIANLAQGGLTGEHIVDIGGAITSPNYPKNYGANENDLWKMTVPENYQVALSFQTIKVEYASNCDLDYIEVIDGHEENSPVLNKICGSQMPQTFVSSGNKMAVKLISDGVKEDSGYYAEFSKVEKCGGSIVSEQGVFQSRNYPANYLPNDMCEWKIRVPDSNKILLKFTNFITEQSVGCSADYVEVLDGHDSTSHNLGRFCGSYIPENVLSSGHKITVRFVSDFLKEYSGFTAEFNIADVTSVPTVQPTVYTDRGLLSEGECVKDIVADRGFIVSPNYPDDYSPYGRCTWRITVPGNNQVVLRFKALRLEGHSSCDYDYVQVLDGIDYGSPSLGKFCGDHIPDEISSSSNEITVNFKSDSSGEYSGFVAVFSKGFSSGGATHDEVPEEDTLCGENFYGEEGIVQSPNYPDNYGANEKCSWKITVPQGSQISLKFLSFNVEIHDTCNYDYVEIREGHTSRSRLIAKLCGYDIPQDIRSYGNELMISLYTDSSSEYSGFSAEFKKVTFPVLDTSIEMPIAGVCGGDIHADSGSLSSPNHPENYAPFTECTWSITVPLGQHVRLMFQSFQLEGGYDCDFDYLMVFDGLGSDTPLLGKFCGARSPGVIRSSENTMTVRFVTDDSYETTGFSANFTKAEICEEYIVAEEGTLQTSNYPNNYEPGYFCTWHITVPEDSRVFFKFLTFEIDYSHGCEEDAVELFDGYNASSNHLGRYCGSDNPGNIYSSGNELTVQFSSNSLDEGRGFSAEFKTDACGGNIVSDSGFISTSQYPEMYRPYEYCTWKITIPEGQRVVLEFEALSLEGCGDCSCDYVEVRDGHEIFSPSLGKFCGSELPQAIHSSTENLLVIFKSDISVQYSGFKAKFFKDVSAEEELLSLLNELPIIFEKQKQRTPKERKPKGGKSNELKELLQSMRKK